MDKSQVLYLENDGQCCDKDQGFNGVINWAQSTATILMKVQVKPPTDAATINWD